MYVSPAKAEKGDGEGRASAGWHLAARLACYAVEHARVLHDYMLNKGSRI